MSGTGNFAVALQRQLDVLAFLRSPAGRVFFRDYPEADAPSQISVEWGATYYWTPEFSHLLATTAPDLPATWTFHPKALPTDYGFCWFGSPLELPRALLGVGHAALPTVAVSWCAYMEGGRGPIVPVHGVPPARDGDYFGVVYFCERAGVVQPHMLWIWRIGESVREAQERARVAMAQGLVPRMEENLLTRLVFFPAALAFMEQRVAVATREAVDRATRRRIPAAAPIEPLVRVIALRRPAEPASRTDGETREVDWSCRWVVSGHWREQFYPSEGTHKTRWIDSYLKGPDGLPVKAPRARLFAVVR